MKRGIVYLEFANKGSLLIRKNIFDSLKVCEGTYGDTGE
jgi:hypothetical protein